MNKVFYFIFSSCGIIVGVICVYIVCVATNNNAVSNTSTKTDTINIDKTYRVSNAKFKGHDYLLFESGEKGEKGYAIFLEHKADCKVCCEKFD